MGSFVLKMMLGISEQKSSLMEIGTECSLILSEIQLLVVLRRG